jgi:hypothetical protein
LREGWDGCCGVCEMDKAINRFRIKCGNDKKQIDSALSAE